MGRQFRIDAIRFRLQFSKKKWATHQSMEYIQMSHGKLRVLDTKIGRQTMLIIPDGPNIIEHYFDIIQQLKKNYRIVIFDLYGFGFSTHDGNYDYSFSKTNTLLLELIDRLNLKNIHLILPCAGGFYGLSFAHNYPQFVKQLILLQTPSLSEMGKWADRIVPSYLKRPYISQLMMPFVEKKFAERWYDYALPRGVNRAPFQKIALESIKNGGSFCLCSLTQGITNEQHENLDIDKSIPTTLIYGAKDFTHQSTNFDSIRQYQKEIDIIKFENCGHFPDLERTSKFIGLIKEKIKT